MVRVSLSQALDALVVLGRSYLERPDAGNSVDTVLSRCHDLVSLLGEASGMALAREIVERFDALATDDRVEVLIRLGSEFAPDDSRIREAAQGYLSEPGHDTYHDLTEAMEAPRQELFRRLNMAPGGTGVIVEMRELLQRCLKEAPQLSGLDYDLKHLLTSWFNRGFLQFERIDWHTSAIILEKLIEYEAVHAIAGWDDLRRRLARDRRCFAFFHPALPDEPLIFVEVALTRKIAGQVNDLLQSSHRDDKLEEPDTAIFYSISNCQQGLAGISFGNFLIKQVVDAIKAELPGIKRFATLSPVPGLRPWVEKMLAERDPASLTELERQLLSDAGEFDDPDHRGKLKSGLTNLCAAYLLKAKTDGAPLDPVARFHLGNGASVKQICWEADLTAKGIGQSYGMMVNYLYDPGSIVANHEAYVREGTVAAAAMVSRQANRVLDADAG